jgi:Dna[CI] antecedent, DciA
MKYPFKKDTSVVRNSETLKVKEVILDMLDVYNLKEKFQETHIISNWDLILGETVAKRTSKLYISKGKLYVKIDSAPLRNELMISKSKVIQLLNESVGEEVLTDLIFVQ